MTNARLFQVKAGMDVVTDVGIVGIESAVGAVAEPVRVVIISGFVLAKDDFPEGSVKIGVDSVEDWLGGGVGGGQVFVMGILIFVKNNLGNGTEEIGGFQSGKADGVVPDDEAITIG